MRTAVVALLVSGVLIASALDLVLGALWVAALVALLWLRRSLSPAAPLVLVASTGLIVWGTHLGWFSRPAPAPYETGWLPRWALSRSKPAGAGDPRVLGTRDQLRVLRRESTRLTGAELERRVGAVIQLARRLDALRGEAPREVAAVEGAARRLARTLAAPEFRNLEGRRVAEVAYLAELDRRLDALRDGGEAAEVLRAVDPAAMAHVSLRPVRDDLATADAALAALVRALGSEVPTATVTATARYDETRGEVGWEVRHVLGGSPGPRLVRIETRALRSAGPPGRSLGLTYAAGDEALHPIPPGEWLDLGSASRGASIVATWTEAVPVRPVRSALRLPAFERVEVAPHATGDDALLTIVLDGHPGIEMPLTVRLPPPSIARVTVPRHALYFGSGPGTAASEPDADAWLPAGGGTGRIEIDLVPRTLLLRNQAFTQVRAYLYRPNPVTLMVIVGLAALTLVLVGRRRVAVPEGR